jgi:transposase-like protein
MNKKSKQISQEIKSRILSESHIPGRTVPDLASVYGISPGVIYRWRREERKLASNVAAQSHLASACVGNFVELSVCDHEEGEINSSLSRNDRHADSITNSNSHHTFQKASFVFDDFSLMIEGKIKVSKIFEAIKILEGPC